MRIVARLNVAPVKSTRLHHPQHVRLERYGVAGNRDFYFVDEDGRLFAGSRLGRLVRLRAEYDAGRDWLTVSFPDGLVADGPAAGDGEALVTDFYGRSVPAHAVEGPWTELLSLFAGRALRLARVDRPGDGNDVEAVTMVSLASVDQLRRRGDSDDPLDAGRFRMTIELDGCAPHEEDTWQGRTARVGGAVVRVGGPVPRCVVTTLDPNTGLRDFPTLKLIKAYRGVTRENQLPFGVYADVVEPGTVRVDDPIELVS